MPIAEDAEHAWSQARLELHPARLLGPEDELRLEAHVAACDPCREALAAVRARGLPPGHGEHIPASVLARWPAIARDLPEIEGELVSQHLRDCPSCGEDLRIAQAHAAPALVRLRPEPVRWERLWAVAATAAAAGFAILLWVAPHGPVAPTPASGTLAPMATGAPESRTRLSIGTAPVAVSLRDVTRGDAHAGAAIVAPGPREPVMLAFEPLDVPDDTPVALEIAAPAGAVLARLACTQRDLHPARQLVVGDDAAPLAAGDYLLRVIAWPGTVRADSLSLAFTVRRRH